MAKVKHREPVDAIVQQFQRFAHMQAAGGIALMAATVIALAWANSPWKESYAHVWHIPVAVGVGDAVLAMSLSHWINDGLMAIFFFVVGMEIKRELVEGELASFSDAALPAVAALGGMVVPASFYLFFNAGTEGVSGWGIPMATDIAFALGVLALLGPRVPLSLKVFLTSLAIVDDIGAVIVIAVFYSADIQMQYLTGAAVALLALILISRLGIRYYVVYTLLGLLLWLAVLKSGVHATVAGVVLATVIPLRSRLNKAQFYDKAQSILKSFKETTAIDDSPIQRGKEQATIEALEVICDRAEAPLHRFERALHPWVTFFIIPVFALANAGVTIEGDFSSDITHPISLGILAGLILGKQIGITLFSFLAVKLGARKMKNVSWMQIYGAAWLGGIGFTMSLFIANLAFQSEDAISMTKLAILAASLVSGITGWLILRTRGSTK